MGIKNKFGFKLLAALSFAFLMSLVSACGTGDTSVDKREESGGNVPSNFVGTYRGTLKATAQKGVLKVDGEDPITIIVRSDNTVEFLGDDPDEQFKTNIGSNGNFNGVLSIDADGCKGDVDVTGTVNGSVVVGNIGGKGDCDSIGSVGLTGTFSASR